MSDRASSLNVFGEPLEDCSHNPLTGFYRNGCCDTGAADRGSHTVCILVTKQFLDYSLEQGNDLTTPQPEYGFPGLRPGDQWCLCAGRWFEAFLDDAAPRVRLRATHQAAVQVVPLEKLKAYAIDLQ